MNIKGRTVTLRALEPGDMEDLRSFHNDPAIASMLVGSSFPISSFEQRQWYERTATDVRNKRFAIELPECQFIGITTVTDLNMKYRAAHHGIMIGHKQFHGHGYGVDAVMATMRFAFEELGLERLETEILEFNAPSVGLYTKRCGWALEGKKRHSVFRGSQWHDSLMLSILRQDYLNLIEKSGYWER